MSSPARLVRYWCSVLEMHRYARLLSPTSDIQRGKLLRVENIQGDVYDPDSVILDTGHVMEIRTEQLRTPVDPAIIIGTGLNYKKHAEECGLDTPEFPMLAFFKQPGAAQDPFGPIEIPACCDPAVPEVDWEVELAVVIGKPCKDVAPEDAEDYILGYTCANDVSARLWQTDVARTGGQWNKGKGFDTFCPLGPTMVLHDPEKFDPHALDISLTVNDVQYQNSNTSDFVFQVGEVVSFLSKGTTLVPGTVILTGTPEGIGMFQKPEPIYLNDEDVVRATIEGIGTLENHVVGAHKKYLKGGD